MANRIKGITVEIGGDTTGLDRALKTVNSSINQTQSALRDVSKLLKLDPSNTELLAQKQRLLKDAITSTKEKLDALKEAQIQAKEQLENGTLGQEKYDALQREIVATEQELRRLQEEAATTSAVLAKLDETGAKLERTGDAIAGAGKKMSVLSTAVAGLGAAAVKTTADFDSAMSQVQATMGVTGDEFQTLRDLAREMGASTKFSATEAAEAINNMAMAGYSVQQISAALPEVLSLAAAGTLDLDYATQLAANGLNVMGLETSDLQEMVDKMALTASAAYGSVSDFGEGLLVAGGQAKLANLSLTDTFTALGILGDNGISASEGGTMLRNTLKNLYTPTDKAKTALEALGVTTSDAEGNLIGVQDVLKQLAAAMDNLTDEERVTAMGEIFDTRTIAGASALIENCGDRWDELSGKIDESKGAAQRMADSLQDNLGGQLTILMSQLQELAISFGDMLMPTIRKIVSSVQTFVDRLNGMDDRTRQIIITIALLVAAIGPFLLILGTVISKVGTAMKGISTLVKGVKKLGIAVKGANGLFGKLGTALGGVSAPILAIVAVVAVLVAAFVHLWNTNEKFRESILATWNKIKETVSGFCQGIVDRLNSLGFSFKDITEVLAAVWNDFCSLLAPVFEGAFSTIATILSTVLNVILGVVDVFISVFKGDWSGAWEAVKGIFLSVWDGVVSIFTTLMDTLRGVADAVLDWFGTSWNNVWAGIKDFFVGIWEGITSFFSGVWSAISGTVSTALDAVYTRISTVFNAVKTIITTIWNAIKTVITSVVDGVKNKVSSVFGALRDTVASVFEGIRNTATSVWNGIKSAIVTPIEAAKDAVKGIIDKIKGFFSGLKLELPKIKLPHFSIKGSFSLSPPSVPKLSIDWYKDGGIMMSPTIFGINGNSLLAGGEAGAEAILPLASFYERLESILSSRLNTSSMERYLSVIAANSGKGIYLDDGTLVGRILPAIDSGLANYTVQSRRGSR